MLLKGGGSFEVVPKRRALGHCEHAPEGDRRIPFPLSCICLLAILVSGSVYQSWSKTFKEAKENLFFLGGGQCWLGWVTKADSHLLLWG